eukprot:CAMPEP_0118810342 /NCGR_PEP_ID=MMETSP1162-20130426/926_1 /TAXON_ID=33656 /ORGANISM="Phaeocystis Sp, Strain CCMP2710" /LENGTH=91 /DNA_ID=CAMNT_0006739869 /DNA_START=215 /DNA_END=491 /DNA_ORIENTATION=-
MDNLEAGVTASSLAADAGALATATAAGRRAPPSASAGVALFVTVIQFSVRASTPRDGEMREPRPARARARAQRAGPRVLLTCGDSVSRRVW